MRSRAAAKKKWKLDFAGFQCGRKERFANEAEAWNRIDGLEKAGRSGNSKTRHLRPYHCPKGDHWHIGHGDR